MKKQFMKRWLISLLLIAIVTSCINISETKPTKAAKTTSGRLITIGGKTITKTMKIADIKKIFGEPKLITSSYWGGNAYTFYGTNYSDYLYLETYSNGSIASYGSISEGFETDTLSYGDTCDNYVRVGTEALNSDNKLYGVIRYTSEHPKAYNVFFENFVENNRSICKHATEMWNAISYLYGYNTPTTYHETLFNINVQLAENGSDWYDYCENTDRDSYFQLCHRGIENFPDYEYPNPLTFAEGAESYSCKEGYAPAFIYLMDEDQDIIKTMGFINPDILMEWKSVSYTEEEQVLLQKVREKYKNSVDTFNAYTNYYDIEPKYDSLPLTGGKLSENVARGAVEFLNSIRIGAGLNPLEYSEELSLAAQCKSTYTVYLAQNNILNSNPHYPPKIDGIGDDYYAMCQKGKGGENLFMCGYFDTNVIGSIIYALSDAYGVNEYYSRGHRYNLLDPRWEIIGVGNTEQQGCHKMEGHAISNVEVVAWPSKGILPVESGFDASDMMTCQFYNGYFGTSDTTVKIYCKNNDTTWIINPANLSDGQDMRVADSLISYMDNSISFIQGGVYEITFEHLKNAQNEEVSYTYRTVYENAYTDKTESDTSPQGLTLGNSSVKINPDATKKINAVITPITAQNKRIYWQSTDTAVATVNECGEVTAISLGDTDIMATTEDGNLIAICHFTVTNETIMDKPESTDTISNSTNGNKNITETKTNNKKKTITVNKSLKFTKTKISVTRGTKIQIKFPDNLSTKIMFTSKNKKIATVSKKGIITTKKKGMVKIVLKKGKKKTVLTVTVK